MKKEVLDLQLPDFNGTGPIQNKWAVLQRIIAASEQSVVSLIL